MYYPSLRLPNPKVKQILGKTRKSTYFLSYLHFSFFLYVHVRLTPSRVIRLTANNIFCYTITCPNCNPHWLSTWLEVGWNRYAFVSLFFFWCFYFLRLCQLALSARQENKNKYHADCTTNKLFHPGCQALVSNSSPCRCFHL